ncbi:immunoglobulin superfamily member 1-like [Dendropsophus ebraccatus]|uniref:immunoglobulin superfamily member 1-like n=1 Tax=Dendropsophus ebraccatus TaxID=150705 RepID=UPI003831BAFA
MGPVAYIFFRIICCSLLIMQSYVQGKLPKPILEIDTEDPTEYYMVGGTASLFCGNSSNAKRFTFRKNGSKDIIKEHLAALFTISSLSESDSGFYTCQYETDSELSEFSDPEYLYVSESYPQPTIIAEPQNIVQSGQNVKITCTSPYPEIYFTLFKGNSVIAEDYSNPFIHVIQNMNKEHAGQYSCRYRKSNMQSHFSSPLMIDVKDLPQPSITWEHYEEGLLKINCTAPNPEKRMWFRLFNQSKSIIDEINDVRKNQVDFIVPYHKQSYPRYYCIYRIRIGMDFADSLISDSAVIREAYTMANIIRLLLSAVILILLTVIVMKHFKSPRTGKSHPPDLPALRKQLAVDSDYTKMEVMKTEVTEENNMALAVRTDNIENTCDRKEATEVLPSKNNDSIGNSSDLTPATTTVYAVVEKAIDEQQTFL